MFKVYTPRQATWPEVLEHCLGGFCHYGFLFLLIWPPFAFGAVHPWAFAALEIHIALLVMAWMLRAVAGRQPLLSTSWPKTRLLPWCTRLSLLFFIATLALQLLPISPNLLYDLSRPTYDLYHSFHPNWPHVPVTLSLHPYATHLGLMKALAYLGLFAFAIDHLRTEHLIRQAIGVITLTAAAAALIGICQHFAGLSAIYGWRDASYAHFFGPFLNRNHFAAYQTMAILTGLALWLALSNRNRQPCSRDTPAAANLAAPFAEPQFISLALLLFALALMTGALALTLSRGGVLSFFAGLSLFTLLHRQSRKRRGRHAHWRLVWIFVGLGLMSLWLGLGPLIERFWQSFSGHTEPGWGDRRAVYAATWAMVKDFPVFGIGLGAFPVIFPRYQPDAVTLRYLQAHSDILQLLAEMGTVGLLTCLGAGSGLVVGMVNAWRQSQSELALSVVPAGFAAMATITLHSCVDFSLRIPANAVLLTVILAITQRCANLPPQDIRYGD